MKNKKSLGQHWLKDRETLRQIAVFADLSDLDTVLEIGPGLGTLTSELLKRCKKVIAVEFDSELARKLPAQFPRKNLEVINEDILSFDLSILPQDYKVVANIPYYITGKIIEKLMTAENQPKTVTLLIQKEVAENIALTNGKMSLLAISTQIFAEVSLGVVVPAEFFIPPPKVDSQVIKLQLRQQPLITKDNQEKFFRIVKAGFSVKRKKLKTSLSNGLGVSKSKIESILYSVGIDPNLRAENLTIDDWSSIVNQL